MTAVGGYSGDILSSIVLDVPSDSGYILQTAALTTYNLFIKVENDKINTIWPSQQNQAGTTETLLVESKGFSTMSLQISYLYSKYIFNLFKQVDWSFHVFHSAAASDCRESDVRLDVWLNTY